MRKQANIATAILALSSSDMLLRPSTQTQIRQKEINISGLFSKISNLQLVAFDKREDDGTSLTNSGAPDNMEMLQLEKGDSASVKAYALNGDDFNEVMSETFSHAAPPKEPTVEEILKKQDQEEKEAAKKQKAQSLSQADQQSSSAESQQNTDDMTITEHMAQVKEQTTQALQQLKKAEEEKARKEAEQEKKAEEERKKQEALAKKKAQSDPKKQDEKEMDDFVEKQLQKQREDREQYDREIGAEPQAVEQKSETTAPKKNIDDIINQHKQTKDKDVPLEEENAQAEHPKNSFKSADEALEHFGQSIAQRQLESQIKMDNEKEEQEEKKRKSEHAEQLAQESKERQEREKQEREEKQRREEEQRQYDDRKSRLLNKLQSFGGSDEKQSSGPGFFEQAQKRMQAAKDSQQDDQEKQLEKETKEKQQLAQQQSGEETTESEADQQASRKSRLQQKLESFQIAEEANGEQVAESASDKQFKETAEEIVTGKSADQKASTPTESSSIQFQKDIHTNNHMVEEINKGQQFSNLVDQVEKEQILKAAKVKAEMALREEREKQQSQQDQQALEKELESERAAQQQQLAQQQMVAESIQAVTAPTQEPSQPPSIFEKPSSQPSPSSSSTDKKFDIHQLIKDAVQHNKDSVKSNNLQQKSVAKPPQPYAKKVVKPIASSTQPSRPKPVVKPAIKPVAKIVKKEQPPIQAPVPVPVPVAPAPPASPVAPSGSLLQTQQSMETRPSAPADPEVAEVSAERLNAKLQKEMAENGVKEPSDIAKALIDDSANDELSGHGFFGKYLKKHRDMKKKAQEQLIREDLELKARKERLKKEMSEKIKADPVIQTPGGLVQKKKKKKTLSERAHQKLIDEQNTKDAEAQEKAQMVVQVSQLAQLPNLGLEINLAPRSEGSPQY